MNKFQMFLMTLQAALPCACGTNYGLAAIAFARIITATPGTAKPSESGDPAIDSSEAEGSSLATIINSYDKPVAEMVNDYLSYVAHGASKPEWLEHAGL